MEAATNIGDLSFRCNICGQAGVVPVAELSREVASCASCRSTPRRLAVGYVRRLLSEVEMFSIAQDDGRWREMSAREQTFARENLSVEALPTILADHIAFGKKE
jgi:hypothetical protein